MAILDRANATEIVDRVISDFAGRGIAISAHGRRRAIHDAVAAASGFREDTNMVRECVCMAIDSVLKPSVDRARKQLHA